MESKTTNDNYGYLRERALLDGDLCRGDRLKMVELISTNPELVKEHYRMKQEEIQARNDRKLQSKFNEGFTEGRKKGREEGCRECCGHEDSCVIL